ncbi:hypothetical protein K8S19_07310 [bacterium]|nr:hypothetical protein [bacterium]
METSAADYWNNTVVSQAAAYQGMSDLPLGQFMLSLLLVIGIMLVLAWLARRFGFMQKNLPYAQEDTLLFYSRFNTNQTLVLLEDEQGVQCIITRGKQIELATAIPQVSRSALWKGPGKKNEKPKSGPLSFQEILRKGLNLKGTRQ